MNVLIIGANQGIGAALANQLQSDTANTIIRTSRQFADLTQTDASSWTVNCDISDEQAVAQLYDQLAKEFSAIDWVINCVGVLHNDQFMPEKALRQVHQNQMSESFMVNAVGHLLVIKSLQPLITQSEQALVCSISARIGSIEDNHLGGWYAYRMSKAALNMGIKTTAIEWSRKHPQVKFLLLHPGTTDTALSKPFQKRLPAGQLQSQETTAGLLLEQMRLHQNHPSKHPLYIDHHGQSIAW